MKSSMGKKLSGNLKWKYFNINVVLFILSAALLVSFNTTVPTYVVYGAKQ